MMNFMLQKRYNMMNDNDSECLPHDVIMYDILTRVPIESVVRFTCVCKLWSKTLLNDKRFALLHQKNSAYSSPQGIIYSKLDKSTCKYYISLFDVDKNQKNIIRFRPATNYYWLSYMEIEQSFNGLLLIHRRKYYHDYIVYNPITSRSVVLPLPVGVGISDCELRLAYDPVGENYKAVCFGAHADKNFCKILTLGEFGRHSWRNLVKPGFRFDKPYYVRNGVVCLNGVLYWLRRTEGRMTVKKALCSANVSTETLYATDLPNDASLYVESLDWNLVKMGESLCYYELASVYAQLRLWVLKKNTDDKCEWVRQRNIELGWSFQNAALQLTYRDLHCNCVIIEIVTNPKLKIIFWWFGLRVDNRKEVSKMYEYYSCDVELEKIELIHDSKVEDGIGEWHANSIAYI